MAMTHTKGTQFCQAAVHCVLAGLQLSGDPQLVRPHVVSSPQVASVWQEIRGEVQTLVSSEPEAGGLLHHGVTIHDSLESSLVSQQLVRVMPTHLVQQMGFLVALCRSRLFLSPVSLSPGLHISRAAG